MSFGPPTEPITPVRAGIGTGIGTEYVSIDCTLDGPATGESMSPLAALRFLLTRLGFSSGLRT